MVVAKLFSNIIQSALGEYANYIEGLSDLNVAYWEGKVELTNLSINTKITDRLKLPFSIHFSNISKMKAVIPWNHLSSKPVTLELEGVYII